MTAPEDFITEVRARLAAIEEHDHDEHDEHDDGTDFAECSACKAAQDALWWLHSRRVQLAREVVRLADERKELGQALKDAHRELMGLDGYLSTCDRPTILENWNTMIASIRKTAGRAEAALEKAGLL